MRICALFFLGIAVMLVGTSAHQTLICKQIRNTVGLSEEGSFGEFFGHNYNNGFVKLQQELSFIKDQLKCSGGVIVERTCYKLPRRVGVKLSYDEAERMCIFHGGVLAQLPTGESYNAVVTYTKRMLTLTA
ncbi:uncharacterized protein LOC143460400 [Clavelina lepadiformis]|uniref:uncharacterized protein LOC143460400 n=1 Tax=Clavelina lepadiformis TaxID=159417 RepID=UPI004042D603